MVVWFSLITWKARSKFSNLQSRCSTSMLRTFCPFPKLTRINFAKTAVQLTSRRVSKRSWPSSSRRRISTILRWLLNLRGLEMRTILSVQMRDDSNKLCSTCRVMLSSLPRGEGVSKSPVAFSLWKTKGGLVSRGQSKTKLTAVSTQAWESAWVRVYKSLILEISTNTAPFLSQWKTTEWESAK